MKPDDVVNTGDVGAVVDAINMAALVSLASPPSDLTTAQKIDAMYESMLRIEGMAATALEKLEPTLEALHKSPLFRMMKGL